MRVQCLILCSLLSWAIFLHFYLFLLYKNWVSGIWFVIILKGLFTFDQVDNNHIVAFIYICRIALHFMSFYMFILISLSPSIKHEDMLMFKCGEVDKPLFYGLSCAQLSGFYQLFTHLFILFAWFYICLPNYVLWLKTCFFDLKFPIFNPLLLPLDALICVLSVFRDYRARMA